MSIDARDPRDTATPVRAGGARVPGAGEDESVAMSSADRRAGLCSFAGVPTFDRMFDRHVQNQNQN
jgi:hypothetical protein